MWHTVVLVIHVLVAFFLISLVLLQRGKGADAGTGFGAGASGTVFGARGSANFLSRSTAVLATLFFVTCLSLVYLSTQAPPDESLIPRAAGGGTSAPASNLPNIDPDELDVERVPAGDASPPVLPPAEGDSAPVDSGGGNAADGDGGSNGR